MRSDAGERAYRHLLKSTVFLKSSTSCGSGALVDRRNRLVLTNSHVVKNDDVSVAFPPPTDAIEAQVDPSLQFPEPRDFIHGRVVWRDATRDLAIVRLERLPDHALPLPLAPGSAQAGQRVHLVGNPGRMQALWVYTAGSVRKVHSASWSTRADGQRRAWEIDASPSSIANRRKHAAWVLEAQLPVNKGDSGGPLVNDGGDLVALNCGFRADLQQVALCIDVREVRYVLECYAESRGVPLALATNRRSGVPRPDLKDLVQALKNEDADIRAAALLDLRALGADSRPALPLLIQMLKDPDPLVCSLASETLERIGPPALNQVALLLDCLKDKHSQIRAYAVTALGKLGPAAGYVRADLDPVLRDPDRGVRRNVLRTWKEIGLSADSLTPTLFAAWEDAPADVRESLANALAAVSSENEGAMPALLKALQVRDVMVRRLAVAAVARFGQAGKTALARSAYPVLLKLLAEDGSTLVRREAAAAVVAVDPADGNAVPLLARALRADKELRLQAALSLEKMGTVAKAAVPELVGALSDTEPDFRQQVVVTLGSIGPAAKTAVPFLIKDIQDPFRRPDALAALARIGAPAVPALIQALETRRLRPVRKEIAETLGEIGPAAKDAINPLLSLFAYSTDKEVRQAAQQALVRIQQH
jgi:HEAT repeat protein